MNLQMPLARYFSTLTLFGTVQLYMFVQGKRVTPVVSALLWLNMLTLLRYEILSASSKDQTAHVQANLMMLRGCVISYTAQVSIVWSDPILRKVESVTIAQRLEGC